MVGTCLGIHGTDLLMVYVHLSFPQSKMTYTMVQVNFRPTLFKISTQIGLMECQLL